MVHQLLYLRSATHAATPLHEKAGGIMLYEHDWLSVKEEPATLEMVLHSAEIGPPDGDFQPMRILTSRGTVDGRLYGITQAAHAVVLAGGRRGGWDGPGYGLYPRLGNALRHRRITAVHVAYRHPEHFDECVLDVLAAIGYLQSEWIRSIVLVGHDLGGSAVMHAAATSSPVRAVALLAAMPDGPDPDELPPECRMLVVHGTRDEIVPSEVSEDLVVAARQPTHLVLYPGASHRLDEVAPQLYALLLDWVIAQLKGGVPR
jgi:pimeloyl-ACP methyl ester carboxylesterase